MSQGLTNQHIIYMDDDMKELHHDDYPSQSAMQEWLKRIGKSIQTLRAKFNQS